ncbi:hypothetical protein LCGC14_2482110, partial [marine sediment metagenome]
LLGLALDAANAAKEVKAAIDAIRGTP